MGDSACGRGERSGVCAQTECIPYLICTPGSFSHLRCQLPPGGSLCRLRTGIPHPPLTWSPVSLRLGHVRVLTMHRIVIHCAHAASLPGKGLMTVCGRGAGRSGDRPLRTISKFFPLTGQKSLSNRKRTVRCWFRRRTNERTHRRGDH